MKKSNFMVKTIVTGRYRENCYLLYGSETRECFVIDPGCEEEAIWNEIVKNRLSVKMILATHAHFDHIGGVDFLRKQTQAPFYLHADEDKILQKASFFSRLFQGTELAVPTVDFFLTTKTELLLEGVPLYVIETPGHTPGGVSFHIESVLFSGDVLFRGKFGQNDCSVVETENLSGLLKKKIMTLPDETLVYPGHGKTTTIGAERERVYAEEDAIH